MKTYKLSIVMSGPSLRYHLALMEAESIEDLVQRIGENIKGQFFAVKAKTYTVIVNSSEVQDIIIQESEETPSNTSATHS